MPHRTLRTTDELDNAIVSIQRTQHRKSWSETATHLIQLGIEVEGMIHFNRACTLLGVTGQREAFSEWRQRNDVPTFATLAEWENYLEAFGTDGECQDLRNTQQDALR